MSGETILAIDTTSGTGGVVVARGGRVLARVEVETRAAVSELVVSMVRDALGYIGVPAEGIAGIVVCRGPGSFTGIRVGLATARALGLGWGRPVRAVTAFESVHAQLGGGSAAVLLDARRGQIYAASMGPAGSGEVLAVDPGDLGAWAARSGDVKVVCGTALAVHGDAVRLAFPRAALRPDLAPCATGVALADLAGVALDDLTPLYVRPPDARLPGPERTP